MTWRESSRTEIQAYYDDEFPAYQSELPPFITPDTPKEYALAFKSAYPTVETGTRPFIRRSTRPTNDPATPGSPVFDSFKDVLAFIRHPADNDPLDGRSALADPALVDADRPVADAVYYAADMWERSWLLWVDIDAKDVAHERASDYAPDADDPVHATGISAAPPKGYPYAFEDIEQAIEYGFEVEAFFRENLCGEQTMVVYSGQGCHVYLLDDDPKHRYDEASRELLNDVLTADYDIPIDTVVTADQSRVARLPYSLHAGVSRIVTPITDPSFDFRTESTPRFLDNEGRTGGDTDAISLPGDIQ
jgi:hypothetical protein